MWNAHDLPPLHTPHFHSIPLASARVLEQLLKEGAFPRPPAASLPFHPLRLSASFSEISTATECTLHAPREAVTRRLRREAPGAGSPVGDALLGLGTWLLTSMHSSCCPSAASIRHKIAEVTLSKEHDTFWINSGFKYSMLKAQGPSNWHFKKGHEDLALRKAPRGAQGVHMGTEGTHPQDGEVLGQGPLSPPRSPQCKHLR